MGEEVLVLHIYLNYFEYVVKMIFSLNHSLTAFFITINPSI